MDQMQQQRQRQQQPSTSMDTYEIVSATLDGTTTSSSMLMLSPEPREDLSVIFLPDDISPEMLHATLSHAADWNEISIAPELVNPGFGFPAGTGSGNTTTSMGSPEDTPLASPTVMNDGHGFFFGNHDNMEFGSMGPMRHRRRRSSGVSPILKPYGSPQSNAAHSGILSPANLLETVPEEVLQCAAMSPDMIQTLSQLFAPLHVMENSFGMVSFPPLNPVTATTAGIPSNTTNQGRRTSMDPTFGAMLEHQKSQRSEIEENILSVNYDDVTVTQMKKLLRQSNLPACGKKSELVERLRREGERLSKHRSQGLAVEQASQQDSVPTVKVTPPMEASLANKQNIKRDQLLVQPPAFLKSLDSLNAKKDVFQLMSPLTMDGQADWILQ